MSKSKRESLCMIGIGLILLSGLLFWFALSLPKVSYTNEISATITDASVSESAEVDSYSSDSNAEATVVFSQQQSTVKSSNTTDNQQETEIVVSYPVNINTCSIEELTTISGIGETRASGIIQYREYIGGYTSVEEIKNIKGIGDALYEKISPYLTV